jgi:hypothetical protein
VSLHPISPRRLVRLIALSAVAAAALVGCSGGGSETITVEHPATPAPTLVAADQGGVGDIRLWNFDGTTTDGVSVTMDWIMTTTAVGVPSEGLETRFATGVFSFDGGDQLILEGTGYYPSAGSTLEVSASTVRVIVGGTGDYAGASGSVESIHLDDDTWQHIFTLD